jgi:UDP-N-acetylmuramoylalanine--D-glutamate ligase
MSAPKNIVILGGGESGVGAALLAKAKGFNVFLSDGGKLKDKYAEQLNTAGISHESGQHSTDKIEAADLIIKSPGIPEKAEIIQVIRKKGIELVSEIEFASRYCPGKMLAITGSNGKTTTTSLLYDILKRAGTRVALGGNIGKSFAALLLEEPYDYYVLEISSFQLDDINSFAPHIAVITNFSPDHLDRYNYQMSEYVAAKFNITRYQQTTDYLVYNLDDAETTQWLATHSTAAQLVPFSLQQQVSHGAYLNDQNKIEIHLQKQETMSINELALQGKHNAYNSMASGLAAKLLGIRKEAIRESLAGFDSIEHRLEPVLQVYGMQFINDSKATNVNSTWYALDSMTTPTIWIVGGVDKGNDYSELYNLVEDKVKAIICLGTDNSKIHAAFEDKVPFMIDASDMSEAVRIAYKLGEKGDTVLLSPACASFDLFENYEDRGRQFKEAVRSL